jgi:ketosteroid isomerase-like protein
MSKRKPEEVEREFFTALIEADQAALDRLLTDDSILIDVMTGSEVTKAALIEILASGSLLFDKIDRREYTVRRYGAVAIINGRTEMSGSFEGQRFSLGSRYTHVLVEQTDTWRMVSAQGTQITAPSAMT